MQQAALKSIYHDWLITEPTTRRLRCECGVYPPGAFDSTPEGARMFLCADSEGDNNLYIVTQSDGEFSHVLREMSFEDVPWPEARLGSWRRYWQTVEWAHWVFDLLGWEPTTGEASLFAALEAKADECPAWVLDRIRQASSD